MVHQHSMSYVCEYEALLFTIPLGHRPHFSLAAEKRMLQWNMSF